MSLLDSVSGVSCACAACSALTMLAFAARTWPALAPSAAVAASAPAASLVFAPASVASDTPAAVAVSAPAASLVFASASVTADTPAAVVPSCLLSRTALRSRCALLGRRRRDGLLAAPVPAASDAPATPSWGEAASTGEAAAAVGAVGAVGVPLSAGRRCPRCVAGRLPDVTGRAARFTVSDRALSPAACSSSSAASWNRPVRSNADSRCASLSLSASTCCRCEYAALPAPRRRKSRWWLR